MLFNFLNKKPEQYINDIMSINDKNAFLFEDEYVNQGLLAIIYRLFKNKVPYHIHGHIHNPYRKILINGTQKISSYMFEYFEI